MNYRTRTEFVLTPRRLGAIAGAGLMLAVVGFWGTRLFVFAAPPTLIINEPQDRIQSGRPSIRISGTTEKESRLTVNGLELTIDERGSFSQELNLQLGVNKLEFIAESRFGKISREARYVLVE